eukprot:6661574-Pyramimonas_sp.AAC.1
MSYIAYATSLADPDSSTRIGPDLQPKLPEQLEPQVGGQKLSAHRPPTRHRHAVGPRSPGCPGCLAHARWRCRAEKSRRTWPIVDLRVDGHPAQPATLEATIGNSLRLQTRVKVGA